VTCDIVVGGRSAMPGKTDVVYVERRVMRGDIKQRTTASSSPVTQYSFEVVQKAYAP